MQHTTPCRTPARRSVFGRRAGTRLSFVSLCLFTVAGQAFITPNQALAQDGGVAIAERDTGMGLSSWSGSVWQAAAQGDEKRFFALLDQMPDSDSMQAMALKDSIAHLRANFAERENQRKEHLSEVRARFEETMAQEHTDLVLTTALRDAVEIEMYSADKAAFHADESIRNLIKEADAAAVAAEDRADWLMANELYYRLSLLIPGNTTYDEKVHELGRRLAMIRLYAPNKLWEMRNERRMLEDEAEPLPPFNNVGEDFREKLSGISDEIVIDAVGRAARLHVELGDELDLVRDGLRALEVFAETPELADTFEGLKDEAARERFLSMVRSRRAQLGLTMTRASSLIDDLQKINRETINIPKEALLHELGNGAMSALDDYSAIIWPDEVRRFERNTSGKFIGIGVQIQMNELGNIEVVTPLEGTPAQRAGVRSGDVIKRVNGESAVGFTLDQAVDNITGPEGTNVVVSIDRENDEGELVEHEYNIRREVIKLRSIKGWKRLDANEDNWNWFVDDDSKIGYIRMTQFHEETSIELDRAIAQMKAEGLQGLVFDLRFNPGGLLDEAVSVVSRFIDRKEANEAINGAVVVSTENKRNLPQMRPEVVQGHRDSLAGIPVVVLINEGSASASEIVSGNLQDYAHAGAIPAVILGSRSFGKGSVQNVWYLRSSPPAALKLTTQYYKLPGGRLIHKHPGSENHGVEPDIEVEMLPNQVTEAILLRQAADVVTLDENGLPIVNDETPNPDDLIDKGTDLQLHTAVVLLKAKLTKGEPRHAQIGGSQR
ncbi:MAG: S41 family peptidase [Phycisphaeraceae bacterium]|nr:S41 family peptidase [Phycisphaerales bacterium]MCB9859099.1 S41 family peptidase [Phycisphaeraceae bacterium]